jgi:hypothetical protein
MPTTGPRTPLRPPAKPPADSGPNPYAKPANHKGPHRSDPDYGHTTNATTYWQGKLESDRKPRR